MQAPAKPFVMDASQRFVEPADLWAKRLAAKHRPSAPKVVTHKDGEAWSFDGGAFLRPLGLEVSAWESPLALKLSGYAYAGIRKGCTDPKERLQDMDTDDIDMASIFPTFALSLRHVKDADLQQACVSAYNDAVWEFCQTNPKRLVPHALMPNTTLNAAMAEVKRAAKTGFKSVVFNGWPSGATEPLPEDDAFWGLCQDAGLVISMVQGGPGINVSVSGAAQEEGTPSPQVEALWAGRSAGKGTNVSWMVNTAIFERFPTLKVALVETGAGWMPYYSETLDDIYRRARFWSLTYLKHTPSEYMRRNVYATVEADNFAVQVRADIGMTHLMWASGYPGAAAARVWPSSRTAIDDQFRGVPEAERLLMTGGNCLALYGLQR